MKGIALSCKLFGILQFTACYASVRVMDPIERCVQRLPAVGAGFCPLSVLRGGKQGSC